MWKILDMFIMISTNIVESVPAKWTLLPQDIQTPECWDAKVTQLILITAKLFFALRAEDMKNGLTGLNNCISLDHELFIIYHDERLGPNSPFSSIV